MVKAGKAESTGTGKETLGAAADKNHSNSIFSPNEESSLGRSIIDERVVAVDADTRNVAEEESHDDEHKDHCKVDLALGVTAGPTVGEPEVKLEKGSKIMTFERKTDIIECFPIYV